MRLSSIPLNPICSGIGVTALVRALRNEENFPRVGILHLGAGRKTFYIDIFAGREGAFHDVRLAGNRDAVGVIAFLRLRSHGGGCGSSGRFMWSNIFRLRRSVGIERLLLRWILLLTRVAGHTVTNARRRLLDIGT